MMSQKDREALMSLAKLFNVDTTGKRSVQVPVEVLAGVSRKLVQLASGRKEPLSREAMRQIWSDPSSRYMAANLQRRCA